MAHHVDRVRNDGNWVIGTPENTTPLHYRDSEVFMNPLLVLERRDDAAPAPTIPGWVLRTDGFKDIEPGQPNGLTVLAFYTPARDVYPTQHAEQLVLF